jgi:hypothetical protein
LLVLLVMKAVMEGLFTSVYPVGKSLYAHPPVKKAAIPIWVYLPLEPPLSPSSLSPSSPLSPLASDPRAKNSGPPLSPWQTSCFFPPAAITNGAGY